MSKIWFPGLIILMVLLMPSLARMETPVFSIAGKIIFSKTGNLYITVVNEIEFSKEKGSVCNAMIEIGEDTTKWNIIPEGVCKAQIENREEQTKRNEVNFKLDGIPQGKYGIKCFQDVTGKGKLIKVLGIPIVPWGVSHNIRHSFSGPTFEEIAFELNKDITDIRIELK